MIHCTIDHTITSQDVIAINFFHESLDFPKASFVPPSSFIDPLSITFRCYSFDLCVIRNLLRFWVFKLIQVPIGD